MRERTLRIGHWSLWIVLVLAVALRVTYLAKTPYTVREHDVAAHIDYIHYMAEHWSVPPADDGWEFHQPPFYYAVAGLVWSAGTAAGWERDSILIGIQILSILFSVLFVIIAWWIGRMVFAQKRIGEWAAFLLVVAVFPALLLTSSRITNDSLAVAMGGLSIALLLQWHKSGNRRDWYLLAVALSFFLLTKITGLLLIPVALGLYAWRERLQWKKAMAPLAMFLLILAALTAWYPLVRMHELTDRSAIPGEEGLDPGVLLPTAPENFLTFHPVKIVEIPYVNPWSDESRRQYFWEYWFRSAFLGEWNFEDALLPWSRAVLVGGLGLMFFAFVGLWTTFQRGRAMEWWVLPAALVFLVFLGGAVAYRFQNTCACAQDFRYVFPVVIPWALFVAAGVGSAFGRWTGVWRIIGTAWIVMFGAVVSAFYILLPFAR